MAKAFPPHDGCTEAEQPNNSRLPLDTAPLLPKDPDGTGIGTPSDISGATPPIGEALPGIVSPPNSEQPEVKACHPGITKAAIVAGATGSVREMVAATEVGDPFDALNHSTTDIAINEHIQICYNREDDAFFLTREAGGVACPPGSCEFPIVITRCTEILWSNSSDVGSIYRRVEYTLLSKVSGLEVADCDELAGLIGDISNFEWAVNVTDNDADFSLSFGPTISALTPDFTLDAITGTSDNCFESFNFDDDLPFSWRTPVITYPGVGCGSTVYEIASFDSGDSGDPDFNCSGSSTYPCCS